MTERCRCGQETALRILRQALVRRREVGDRHGEAVTLYLIARVLVAQGRHGDAVACNQQSATLYSGLGARWGLATSLSSLGEAYCHLGRQEQAEATLHHALVLCRELDHRRLEADTLTRLGMLRSRQGRHQQASATTRRRLRFAVGSMTGLAKPPPCGI